MAEGYGPSESFRQPPGFTRPTGFNNPAGFLPASLLREEGVSTPPTPQPLSFGSATIANQAWTVGTAVSLDLPVASGGTGTITYALTPTLPAGITRTGGNLSGTPTAAFTSATFTWTATAGSETVTLTFTIVVAATVPGTLASLTASAGEEQATLTWTPPASDGGSAITKYQQRYQEVGASTWSAWTDVAGGGAARSVTITGLTGDVEYTFRVRAVNAIGNGPESGVRATPTEAPTVPGVPRNLAATAGDGEVDLTWDAPSHDGDSAITSYQYRVDSGSWVTVSGGGTARSVTVGSLTNGTAYSFTLRAVNAVGNSTATAAVSATPVAPAVPLSFGANTIAGQSWTVGTSVALTLPEATGGTGTITYALTPALPAGVTRSNRAISGTPTTAATSATYTWTATDGDGDSVELTFTIVVAAIAPGAPATLTSTNGVESSVLTWTPPTSNGGSAITAYQYRVSDDGGTTWSPDWTTVAEGGIARSIEVSSLTGGTTYTFEVRAVNVAGNGPAVSTTATPTASMTTPSTPVELPTDLPSGWFVVPPLEGEVGRMWIAVGPNDSNYVWGESPRPVVGQAYRNSGTAVLDDDTPINAIRIPGTTTLRLHASSGAFSTHIAANDGGAGEPNRSLFVYASATEFDEFRYDGITNAGGGFVNWALNTGDKVLLRGELDTDGTRFILVVADATT